MINLPRLARRNACGLRGSLGQDHAGDQRIAGEMAAEEWLRAGEVFGTNSQTAGLEGDDLIDEDKWLAMRQAALDGVQGLHLTVNCP